MSNMRELIDLYERWESKPTTFSSKFPIVTYFEDYHDISVYADQLSRTFNAKIKSKEIKTNIDGRYWGVFWVGKAPSKEFVMDLLNQAKEDDY